jgi:hypothetical protein
LSSFFNFVMLNLFQHHALIILYLKITDPETSSA